MSALTPQSIRVRTMAALAVCLLVQYGHLCSMTTCAIWLPVQHGHPVQYGHLDGQYGHLYDTATCAMWPYVQYGHMCNTATYAAWPHVQYGYPWLSSKNSCTHGSHRFTQVWHMLRTCLYTSTFPQARTHASAPMPACKISLAPAHPRTRTAWHARKHACMHAYLAAANGNSCGLSHASHANGTVNKLGLQTSHLRSNHNQTRRRTTRRSRR